MKYPHETQLSNKTKFVLFVNIFGVVNIAFIAYYFLFPKEVSLLSLVLLPLVISIGLLACIIVLSTSKELISAERSEEAECDEDDITEITQHAMKDVRIRKLLCHVVERDQLFSSAAYTDMLYYIDESTGAPPLVEHSITSNIFIKQFPWLNRP